jgi:hypothetical protein
MWNYAHDSTLRYGSAVTSDFIKHAEEVSGKDLTDFFDTWVYKEGYPTYTFDVEQTDPQHATLILSQLPSDTSVKCFNMPVPILFSGAERDTLIVFENNALEQNFSFSPGFTINTVTFDPDKWLVCKSKSLFVGIEQLTIDNGELKIYPNPTKGELTISLPNPSEGGAYKAWEVKNIEVYDVFGCCVDIEHPTLWGGLGGLDISHLPSGIYFIRIQTENGVVTKKVVKD